MKINLRLKNCDLFEICIDRFQLDNQFTIHSISSSQRTHGIFNVNYEFKFN